MGAMATVGETRDGQAQGLVLRHTWLGGAEMRHTWGLVLRHTHGRVEERWAHPGVSAQTHTALGAVMGCTLALALTHTYTV